MGLPGSVGGWRRAAGIEENDRPALDRGPVPRRDEREEIPDALVEPAPPGVGGEIHLPSGRVVLQRRGVVEHPDARWFRAGRHQRVARRHQRRQSRELAGLLGGRPSRGIRGHGPPQYTGSNTSMPAAIMSSNWVRCHATDWYENPSRSADDPSGHPSRPHRAGAPGCRRRTRKKYEVSTTWVVRAEPHGPRQVVRTRVRVGAERRVDLAATAPTRPQRRHPSHRPAARRPPGDGTKVWRPAAAGRGPETGVGAFLRPPASSSHPPAADSF